MWMVCFAGDARIEGDDAETIADNRAPTRVGSSRRSVMKTMTATDCLREGLLNCT